MLEPRGDGFVIGIGKVHSRSFLPRSRQENAHPPPCLEQKLATSHSEGDGS